jgi:hypothetical protein
MQVRRVLLAAGIVGSIFVSAPVHAATATTLKAYGIFGNVTVLEPGTLLDVYDPGVNMMAELKSGGAPVVGRTVTFFAAGRQECFAVTDSRGNAACPVANVEAFAYAIAAQGYTAEFAGDNNYAAATATAGLTS